MRPFTIPFRLLAASLLAITLLGGCALRPPPAPAQAYLLGASRGEQHASRNVTLQLAEPGSGAPFSERALVYRESEQRYVQDFYHVFHAPPAQQLRQRLAAWLQDAGFGLGGSDARWQLRPRLDALYIDVREPKSPQAVVGLELELWQSQTSGPRLVARWPVTTRRTLPSAQADSAMAGLDLALADALREIELKLAEAVSRTSP
ncbi:ABC-type transport auxiliary lipoprotein family protein [Chitinilyticum litopenaei]|uniref:ABC-type transport auxiliary lipoprotein family protein n=1 Tax=Chitinilyticum litopenaei TaxID=1121276 RepID=UPI0003F5BCD8|nr:ABC-type transport auxiliary lipoprotein family protein [Chitinilyticum litopenaei]